MTLRWAAVAAFLLDRISKAMVMREMRIGQSHALWGTTVQLTYIQNPGAAFGFLADSRAAWRIPFFIFVTIAASLLVYAYQRVLPPEQRLVRMALGLIWGGALGNFVDRIWLGRVVDFIDVGYQQYRWPVFNLADSCITVGLALLILNHFWKRHPGA